MLYRVLISDKPCASATKRYCVSPLLKSNWISIVPSFDADYGCNEKSLPKSLFRMVVQPYILDYYFRLIFDLSNRNLNWSIDLFFSNILTNSGNTILSPFSLYSQGLKVINGKAINYAHAMNNKLRNLSSE